MQTIQYRKSRIWEINEDKYTKSLAKNQVCVIFHLRDIRTEKRFTQICKALYPLRDTNMAAGNQQQQ